MGATYINPGVTVDYPTGVDLTAGTVIVLVDLVGVVQRDTKAGKTAALVIEGNMRFPKTAGGSTAIPQGTILYWNAGGGVVSTSSSGNKLLGKAAAAAVDADTDVLVRKVA